MKNRQAGFGIIEILLIVAIVGLLGFIGWSAYDASRPSVALDGSKDVTNLATLSGIVTQKSSVPVENHTIQAVDAQGRVVDSTKTDVKGKYQLRLPPGEYDLELVPAVGLDDKVATVTVKVGDNTLDIPVDTDD